MSFIKSEPRLKYYAIFKKTDLLKSEKTNEYYRYILFWPFFKLVEKNPFERLAYCLFKNYGDDGVTYYGWGGLRNFYNDLVKGKDRYKNINVFVLRFELKQPIKGRIFTGSKFVKILIAKQNEKYTYYCGLSHENYEDDSWSIYDLDDSPPLSKDNLIDKLKKLHLNENEIEDILQKL